MTKIWWMYVVSFIAGISLTIIGMVRGDAALVGVGVIIGIALYFNRGRIQ